MTKSPHITRGGLGHGRSTRIVIIDEAHHLRTIVRSSELPDPHWPDQLPGNVYRLVSWLQLTALPEHDATLAVSKLSRHDLSRDDRPAHARPGRRVARHIRPRPCGMKVKSRLAYPQAKSMT
jgi:hypothetical protein